MSERREIHKRLNRIGRIIVGSLCTVFVLVVFSNCSTTSTGYLLKSDADRIKRIAIVSSLSDNRLHVFDKTGPARNTYLFVPATPTGIIGGLAAAGTIKAIDKEIKKRRSVGGDPDDLARELEGFPIEATFDNRFTEVFAQTLSVVHPQETKNIGRIPAADGTIDYSSLQQDFAADTVLTIDFQYGLAAYAGETASAAINAQVSMVNIAEKRVIMSRTVLCDTRFLGGHTVEEYKADKARLFREEIAEAARSMAKVILVYVTMPLSNQP
jgi:hypothetical protein